MNPKPYSLPDMKTCFSCPVLLLTVSLMVLAVAVQADPVDFSYAAHLKYRYQASWFPEDSLYREAAGNDSQQQLLDNRWNFRLQKDNWDTQVDYQLQALESDLLTEVPVEASLFGNPVVNDDRRLMDLTHVLSSDEDTVLLHRLDRFNLGYTADQWVVRAGRQVVSWGNGLLFNPMDFFNPFDPAALDTEYKTGDDMLYGQMLFDSGDDLQGVWVVRRDDTGSVDDAVNSTAAKYHRILDNGMEVNLLLSRHYEDDIAGLGLTHSLGGALWRSDFMLTRTEDDEVFSFVTNLSWSWVWADTNFNGVLEYFYNGFGQHKNDYNLLALEDNQPLLDRLSRGELFSIGKHYLAATATIELTPLWLASPTLFVNLADQSALLQLSSVHDLAQNWQLIAALNLPMGPEGTEYGGLQLDASGTSVNGYDNLASDGGIFIQLAFYF